MRKTIAVISATGALLFGGAGVANATIQDAPAPSSTTTTLADNNNGQNTDQHSDNNGLWGLLGLLGLGGLVGLKRRKDTDTVTGIGTTATPGRGV
jgi:LPXTG-motif cell wall-anchored protein